ncbi:hypothetical protein DERP_008547 [Dermatophagoides pteronyssinus]|uniref:Uncharacterized protein n=1 Tax=Dermatophagoides pteronyssinus TaxID=6956 RepID=A0ABQ8IWP4_DERPT|nr:hypothetical protein DERP_008547 [Dermatophagoides pteronyssinus]
MNSSGSVIAIIQNYANQGVGFSHDFIKNQFLIDLLSKKDEKFTKYVDNNDDDDDDDDKQIGFKLCEYYVDEISIVFPLADNVIHY